MGGQQDDNFEHFAAFEIHEGEEHVPKLLMNEALGGDKFNLNLATDSRVPGRVLGHHEVYKEIGADPYIVNLVQNGYRLEFDQEPPTASLSQKEVEKIATKKFQQI